MKSIINKIKKRLEQKLQWKPKIYPINNLIKIGTEYGGWTIPDGVLSKNSICYLVGAGEDISFDVGLVEKYACQTYIFDPTPRAKTHFDELIKNVNNKQKMPINHKETEFYNLSPQNINLLHFRTIGLWDKSEEVKFFAPKNSSHVSHSIVNLQQTQGYFMAQVHSLSAIMKQEGHTEIDLLKIDIEGAEYAVIDSIISDNIKVKIINIEFDEGHTPLDKHYMKRIKEAIIKLQNYGYKIVDRAIQHNYTLINNDLYSQIK